MKKTMVILISAALVLILAVGGLIWYLISAVSGAGSTAASRSVEDYLAEQWPGYRVEEWENGVLHLSRSLKLTYEQLEKYGDQPEMNELVEGHLETLEQIAVGMIRNCGAEPKEITITGLSSDGQAAYTVRSDGTISTCWSAWQEEKP